MGAKLSTTQRLEQNGRHRFDRISGGFRCRRCHKIFSKNPTKDGCMAVTPDEKGRISTNFWNL